MAVEPDQRRTTIDHLARQLRRLEGRPRTPRRVRNEGAAGPWVRQDPEEVLFPEGGLREGMLVEWLAASEGSGAATLLMLNAARWVKHSGNLVVVDPRGCFYPPAVARWGIDLQRCAVIRPTSQKDTFWALEQSLRCPGVAATVCWLQEVNDLAFRRLQLAAEQGGGVGLLWRPARYRFQPSWADIRFHVSPRGTISTGAISTGAVSAEAVEAESAASEGIPAGRRLHLERLRGRGDHGHRHIQLELNDETGAVRVVPELAPATFVTRAAGA